MKDNPDYPVHVMYYEDTIQVSVHVLIGIKMSKELELTNIIYNILFRYIP